MKSNKKTVIILIVCIVVFLICLILSIIILTNNKNARTARIYQNGNLLYEIDLSSVKEPYTLNITSESGGYNIVEVRPGEIGICKASCPDKVCVNMGFINNSSLPITCLPNKLIIKLESDSEEEADVVVY